MAIDITLLLDDQPGELARVGELLGRAGVNIEGACGYLEDGVGVYHVLVQEAQRARRALMDSGFEIRAERSVVVVPIEETVS